MAESRASTLESMGAEEGSLVPARRRRRVEGNAWRGLKRSLRGYSRFSALIFFAALVIAGATALRCEWGDWCLLLGAIGLVLTTELCHGAVQCLVRGSQDRGQAGMIMALDIAAAAGLVATIVAGCIGALVFLHRLGLAG
jgi:diacylglycerol kinase